jgi:hypothetical protein
MRFRATARTIRTDDGIRGLDLLGEASACVPRHRISPRLVNAMAPYLRRNYYRTARFAPGLVFPSTDTMSCAGPGATPEGITALI